VIDCYIVEKMIGVADRTIMIQDQNL